ncbi:MAG TPA: zinc-binding dehydrogenase [Chloroflexota bacterium]|nr:zinc-binding dehydrogenase [Chloroflexota bacterium]
MPSTMRAAILAELHAPLRVDEVQLPDELDFGQVLVRLHYTSICGAQLGEIDGVKGPDKFLPHLLGHEGSGVVQAIGRGVTQVAPGQRVVLHWMKGAGVQADPPRYRWRGRDLNAGWVTTFNDWAVVSENRVTPIPKSLPMDLAPLFGCAVTTGLGVVTNNAHLGPGESIVVFGVGGVGLNVVQAASLVSARPIIGVDLYDSKLDLARSFGADHVLNSRRDDSAAEIQRILGPGGADVVVETTGNTAVIEQAYALAGPQGRVVLVGVPKKDHNISIHSLPLHFGKVLTGSYGGQVDPTRDIPRLLRLYDAGVLQLQDMISCRIKLTDINEGITRLRLGAIAGRCLIDLEAVDD